MAGCWVALGCPSWAMTLRLCVVHSMRQTSDGLITRVGSDGPAVAYEKGCRKDWECQDLRGLVFDGLSASFYTIKGLAVKSADLRAGGTQSLFTASAPGSALLPLTQRSFPFDSDQSQDPLPKSTKKLRQQDYVSHPGNTFAYMLDTEPSFLT